MLLCGLLCVKGRERERVWKLGSLESFVSLGLRPRRRRGSGEVAERPAFLGRGLDPVWRVRERCLGSGRRLCAAEGVFFLTSGVWCGGVPAELGSGGSACGASSGLVFVSLAVYCFCCFFGFSGRGTRGSSVCAVPVPCLGGRRLLGVPHCRGWSGCYPGDPVEACLLQTDSVARGAGCCTTGGCSLAWVLLGRGGAGWPIWV